MFSGGDNSYGGSSNAFGDVSGFLHKAERRSSLGMNSSSHVAENHEDRGDDDHFKMQQDDKALTFLKTTVIVMLLVSGAIVGRATHMLVTKEEQEVFQSRFNQDARSLLDTFESQVEKRMRVASMLSTSITSLAIRVNTTWPVITIPDFHVRTMDAMALTGASALYFSPLVTSETRSAWEAHVGGNILQQVNGQVMAEQGPDPYFPIFQVTPPSEKESLFFNQFSEETHSRALASMITKKAPMVAEVNFEDALTDSCVSLANNMLFIPVFDSFDKDRQVVGSLLFKCDWRDYFAGHNKAPLVVVVENSCGQQLTFEVSSQGVHFMGNGSLHDAAFSDMDVLSDYLNMSLSRDVDDPHPQASTATNYQEVPVLGVSSPHACRYRIRIYPTQDLHNEMHTQRPALYAFTVAMQLFFFAGVLFIAYDFMIRKRQDEILEQAAKSTALVESLFPSQVRDQVMESTTRRDALGSSGRTTQPRRGSTGKGMSTEEASEICDYSKIEGPPIANLFSSTTIMVSCCLLGTLLPPFYSSSHTCFRSLLILLGLRHGVRLESLTKYLLYLRRCMVLLMLLPRGLGCSR
jgi:hypothetical protein